MYSTALGSTRVRLLPSYTHTVLLALLCDSSFILVDEICGCTLSFTVYSIFDLNNNSTVVSFVSRYAVNCRRMFSPVLVVMLRSVASDMNRQLLWIVH